VVCGTRTRLTPGAQTERRGEAGPGPGGPAKHLLHRIYYAQRTFESDYDGYARSLAELGLADLNDETLAGPPSWRRMTTTSGRPRT
jgi:hypothetical protein